MRKTPAHHIDQQPFIGFRATLCKGLLQVQIQIDRQHVHAATRLLREHLQLDRFLRLQLDDQPVAIVTRPARNDRERQVGEVDHNLRLFLLQALARTQEERHVRPAPVVDMRPDCHERLGTALRRHVVLFQISLDRLAADRARTVLATHGIAGDIRDCHLAQRTQHLQFFIAHGIRIERHGRLHGHDAQQLQQMVLHHVAQCAGLVVEARTAAHAYRFRYRNLHALDVRRLPQRPEDRVAETQHHQVLHRFLAEIMVDAVDLRFGEMAAD